MLPDAEGVIGSVRIVLFHELDSSSFLIPFLIKKNERKKEMAMETRIQAISVSK